MQLGHLLTRSGLTLLDVSLMVSPCFFLPFGLQFFIIPSNILQGILFICWKLSYNKSQRDALLLKFILPTFKISVWKIPTAVYTVLRLLMMDSRSVRNMQSSSPKQIWEIVHLVGFYYKNISRCTVLWMSKMLKPTSSVFLYFVQN